MKYLSAILTTVLVLMTGVFCTGQNYSKIEPELQAKMGVKDADAKLPILILMEEQCDSQTLESETRMMTREGKRQHVVSKLKAFSKKKQSDILKILQKAEQNGEVDRVVPLWIVNAVCCKATPDLIMRLSERSDIKIISDDEVRPMIPEDLEEMGTESGNVTRDATLEWNVSRVQADRAWELGYTGSGVIVAIVDSGVNYNHTDISNNMWTNSQGYHGYDYVNYDNYPLDDHRHGTHCAGTVAGYGTNGKKTGVAPGVKIMAVKVLSDQGSGSTGAIATGVEYALDNGADIINCSAGGSSSSSATERQLYEKILSAGVLVAKSAGNNGNKLNDGYALPNNVSSPAQCPPPWLHPDQKKYQNGGTSGMMVIGSVNRKDLKASSSSIGPCTWQYVSGYSDYAYTAGSSTKIGLIRPDVAAPGVNIVSLDYANNTGYRTLSGTSMATPCAAGVMALLLQANPSLTPAGIDSIMEWTAVKCADMNSKNNYYGSGRVNAYAAVRYALAVADGYKAPKLTASTGSNSVTLTWTAVAGVANYEVYRDNTLIASPTTTTYTDSGSATLGRHIYQIVAVIDSRRATTSNSVATKIEVSGDSGITLAGTLIGNTANLTWTDNTPMGEATLRYGDAETPSSSSWWANSSTYFGQRYAASMIGQYAGRAINSVSVYVKSGTYTLTLYAGSNDYGNGTLASNSMFSTSFTASSTGWINVPVNRDLNYLKDLWVVITVPEGVTYPAAPSVYYGEGGAALYSSDLDSWTVATDRSWLIKLNLSGSSGTTTYNLYRDGVKIAPNLSTNSYTDAGLASGSHTYYVKPAYDGTESSDQSNSVTLNVSSSEPVATELTATLNGSTVDLEWTKADSTSSTLSYGFTDTPSGGGWGYSGYTGTIYFAQHYLASNLASYAYKAITKVKVYINNTSASYTMKLCKSNPGATTFGDAYCTKSFTPTSTGIYEVELDNPVSIDLTKDLWVVFSTTATYPAAPCVYEGDNNYTAIYSKNGTSWDKPSNPRSWIIQLTFADDSYTYNIYRNGSLLVNNVSGTTYTDINPVVGENSYYVTANYYGTEAVATSNIATVYYGGASSYYVTAIANPEEGGTVSGTGNYATGTTCTVTATPASGYIFSNWSENGVSVSTNATYSFTVTNTHNLTANFTNVEPGTIAVPAPVCDGESLDLTAPSLPSTLTQGWQIASTSAFASPTAYSGQTLDASYNNWYLRYFVTTPYETLYSNSVQITISPTYETSVARTVCQDEFPYVWNGVTFEEAGTLKAYLKSQNDCDSTVNMTLSVKPSYEVSSTRTICPNLLPYTWNDSIFTEAGVKTTILDAINGCDSIVIMTLNVYDSEDTKTVISTCSTPYTWHETDYSTSGTYAYDGISEYGCPYTDTLVLTISDNITNNIYVERCETYTWTEGDGQTYTESGVHSKTYTMSGCDSVVVLNLTIFHSEESEFSDSACETYTWDGGTHTTSGDYEYTYSNIHGCDSTVTLHLTIKEPVTNEFSASATGSYTWNDVTYTSSGDYVQTFMASNGCDSTVTLHLTLTGGGASVCSVKFTLRDSYGDGWNKASLTVSFDDGSASQTLTFPKSSAYIPVTNKCDTVKVHTLNINSGTTATVVFNGGDSNSECFFSIAYTDGETIYSCSKGDLTNKAGKTITSFEADCGGDTYYTVSAMANPVGGGTISGAGGYIDGGSCTLIASPATGYEFVNWTVNNVQVSTNATYTFTVTGNTTLVANFAAIDYTISIASVEHGEVSTTPLGTANVGTSVTVSAEPDAGYELATLTYSYGGTPIDIIESKTFTMPAADVTVTATFVAIDYTISIASVEHGEVSTTPSGTANVGTSVTVSAEPDAGYELATLTYSYGGNTPVDIKASKTFTMPAADVTVTATFAAIDYTITIASVEHGEVSTTPSGTATVGTSVTVSAEPDAGYELATLTYSYGGNTPVDIKASKTFTMPAADVTVTATFVAIDYTISIASVEHGEVSTTPSGTATVGTSVTVSAEPDAGYELATLTYAYGGNTPVDIKASKTFTMPAADVTVTATFVETDIYLWTQYVTSNPGAGHYTEDGDGNITISSARGLAWLVNVVNGFNGCIANDLEGKTVTLTTDIDLNDYIWVPIGYSSLTPFKGTFDGQCHSISNIHIANASEISIVEGKHGSLLNIGLFGEVYGTTSANAVIKNTFVTSGTLMCNKLTGSIGSLAGSVSETDILFCEGAANITASSGTSVGGLVGSVIHDSSVKGCMAMSTISSSATNTGGLIGACSDASLSAGDHTYIEQSFANSTILSSGLNSGAVVGYLLGLGWADPVYVHPSASGADNILGDNSGLLDLGGKRGYAFLSSMKYKKPTIGTATACLGYFTATSTRSYGNYEGGNVVTTSSATQQLTDELNQRTFADGSSLADMNLVWERPFGATAINGDYPILLPQITIGDRVIAVAAFNGSKALRYGSVDELIAACNANSGGGTVYMYQADNISVSTDEDVKVYIAENVPMTQTATTVNAVVGITLDNSNGTGSNNQHRDWHTFSTPLNNAPLGITYLNESVIAQSEQPIMGTDYEFDVNGYFPEGISDSGWFDFYAFSEPHYHWVNFKRNSNSHWYEDSPTTNMGYENETTLTQGKGYLVAVGNNTNADTNLMQAAGVLGNNTIKALVTTSGSHLTGYNFLGNPYQSYLDFDAFAEANTNVLWGNDDNCNGYRAYLVYDADSARFVEHLSDDDGNSFSIGAANDAGRYINMHQGFFVVKRTNGNDSVRFTNDMRVTTADVAHYRNELTYPLINIFCTDSNGKREVSVIELQRPKAAGSLKMKDVLSGKGCMYIHWDNDDFSNIFIEDMPDYVPVWFRANEDGVFTISWTTANADFSDLHLVDNITGIDIDCNTNSSYTFEANENDSKARFRLVMSPNGIDDITGQSENFAFFDNGRQLIVNGSGDLQLIDLNGRILSTYHLSGQQSRIGMPTLTEGIYLLRLIGNESTRTQKIVLHR